MDNKTEIQEYIDKNYVSKKKIEEYIKNNKKIYEMKTPNKNRIIYKECVLIDNIKELLK